VGDIGGELTNRSNAKLKGGGFYGRANGGEPTCKPWSLKALLLGKGFA